MAPARQVPTPPPPPDRVLIAGQRPRVAGVAVKMVLFVQSNGIPSGLRGSNRRGPRGLQLAAVRRHSPTLGCLCKWEDIKPSATTGRIVGLPGWLEQDQRAFSTRSGFWPKGGGLPRRGDEQKHKHTVMVPLVPTRHQPSVLSTYLLSRIPASIGQK